MELYFLRHAIAVERNHPKYKDDSLRPLTASGRKKMKLACHGMKTLGLTFDAILSSPYTRARQTAEIAADTYKINKQTIYLTNSLLPPSSVEKLFKELRTHFPKSKKALFVGHEPHLTEMISSLLKCTRPLPIHFKKGGLCCLQVTSTVSVLNWLLTPTQLGLIKKQ